MQPRSAMPLCTLVRTLNPRFPRIDSESGTPPSCAETPLRAPKIEPHTIIATSAWQNLRWGLIASASSAAMSLAAVPIYIRKLGVEAYGLIGAFAALTALVSLLDFGLSPTLNREVSRSISAGDYLAPKRLLHTFAVVYWISAAVLGVAALAIAPFLAPWFRHEQISRDVVANCLSLMGLVIAARWPQAVYSNALLGAEKLAIVSVLSIAMTIVYNLGGVLVILLIAPRLEYFFGWQAFSALLHLLLIRFAAWRVFGRPVGARFSPDDLRRTWRFSAGLSFVAFTAVVLTQFDRVVLSRSLSLHDFGQYAIAVGIASASYLLVNPVFNVIYPRFTALVTRQDNEALVTLYRAWTRAFASSIFPMFMGLAVSSMHLLWIWTGDRAVATNLALPLTLLCAGTALHCVMFFPYALQLAHGTTRLSLIINSILIAVAIPLIAGLALTFGLIGGAAAVLLWHLMYFSLGSWLTHRTLLRSHGMKWVCADVGVPLCICMVLGLAGYSVAEVLGLGTAGNLALSALLVIAAWGFLATLSPVMRQLLSSKFFA